ncbi:hypothetical protein [Moorena sp. SIO4G3]|uniref:hypothetical protein n=1 Tax=Moorena sp. SIO4G3 TaxID=2607821 RepID=UPI00142CCA00|nr:hypothetical protein [Moorena sp. SIO4G3]NEO80827.1 hypothetical protein [Moorena sp. SIO4G3]
MDLNCQWRFIGGWVDWGWVDGRLAFAQVARSEIEMDISLDINPSIPPSFHPRSSSLAHINEIGVTGLRCLLSRCFP